MNASKMLLSAVCALASLSVAAAAETISQFDTKIPAGSATQTGRLSRSGVPSDWSVPKTFPGVINTTTKYEYVTFDFTAASLAQTPFIQVSIFDYANSGANFLSAYAGSYDPTQKMLNYLGDTGSSPNYFGTDAVSFQVIAPSKNDLILVLNDTHAGNFTGAGSPVNILVEGFTDTSFSDPAPVPEPSTFALLGTGLTGLFGLSRRLRRSA